ncbi:MAG: restriction endonuclease subunit S [Gallionella sp.]
MSNDFRLGTLNQLIDFRNGKAIKKSNGGIPIYGGNGVLGYSDKSNYENTLIVGRVGAYCGSVHIETEKCWVSDNAIAGLPKAGYNNEYNYYLLKSLRLNEQRIGSSQPLLTQGILNNIQVKIQFNSKQQDKIAAVLSALDAKIACNNRINAELEAMAKTLYDYWFVQFDFPYDFALGKPDTNGKPYRTSGGKMTYNPTLKREIPAGWEANSLGRFEPNIVTGKTPSKTQPEYFNGSVPFITIGDIRGNTFIVKTEESLSFEGANSQKNKYLPENALCVTCIASPGLVGFVTERAQTNQQINSLICEQDYTRYFLYFAISGYFSGAKAKTGNTFANMNKSDFSDISIIEPSQYALELFHNKVLPMFESIKSRSKENQHLTQLRDWLLPMLMNGQVTVA